MLVGTENNYVIFFEPRFKPQTLVVSIGRVTIYTYQRIKLMCKLLKYISYFYLSSYLSVVQWTIFITRESH
jgi:hypothetical protein